VPVYLYILKRLLSSLPTLLAVSIIGFCLMRYHVTLGPVDIPWVNGQTIHLMDTIELKQPIDPLGQLRNNPQISPAALEKETERLGLDQPFMVQYWRWLTHVLQVDTSALTSGQPWRFFQPDFGKTFNGEEVTTVLMSRAGNTALLNITSMVLTWLVAIPIGVYAAVHWRSLSDRLLTLFSAFGMALPSFVLALLLAMFAVKTGWFPLGGLTSVNFEDLSIGEKILDVLWHLALPTFVLSVGGISSLQRQMRGNLLDVLSADYLRTARAKGLSEPVVLYKHAVRTAVNPLITLLGYEFSALLGGSLLVETVLAYPGLGTLTYQAALKSDTNLVMASLVMSSVMLVLGNLMADIVLKYVDPRIEL
jgi:peptide/nickel transport system permease protein